MGPNIIFDKSFLQSINPDESVWLDMFFCTVLTPLFYIETLADLEKEVAKGRTPQDVVGNLAYKTPDMYVYPNIHHSAIIEGELLGYQPVDMRFGRPIVGGGRETLVDGKRGVVFEQSAESKAFYRWQRRDFLQLEKIHAKAWRQALSVLSSANKLPMFPNWYGKTKPVNLYSVKDAADSFIDGENIKSALSFGLTLVNIRPDLKDKIINNWESKGGPEIRRFAPYFRHVYGINLFFELARSANLISDRTTNMIDIAYLYYLPFCMVFTSNDKLHADTVPLFIQPHQSFVWGPELKKDLSLLDGRFSNLPDEVKSKGPHYFASKPPKDTSFLVTRIWDRHMRPNWRNLSSFKSENGTSEFEKEIIETVKRAAEAPKVESSTAAARENSLGYVVIKHLVHRRKGKWNRFPPDIVP